MEQYLEKLQDNLEVGGDYAFRIRGENHVWTPDTIKDLQHAVRGNFPEKYQSYAKMINEQSEQKMTPRGLFKLKTNKKPLDINEVESADNILELATLQKIFLNGEAFQLVFYSYSC